MQLVILLKSLFLQIHRSIWLLLLLNLFNFAPSLKFDIFNSSWIKPPFICLQDHLLWNWHSSTLICICAEPSLPLSYLSSLMSFCFWAIILTGVLICQMKSKRPELLSLCLKIHPFFLIMIHLIPWSDGRNLWAALNISSVSKIEQDIRTSQFTIFQEIMILVIQVFTLINQRYLRIP